MKRIITTLLFVGFCCALSAQKNLQVEYSDDMGYHVVITIQKGQTLYSLSKLSGTDITTIKQINEKQTISLALGERLIVPVQETHLQHFDQSLLPQPQYHTVVKGDNLFQISQRYGSSVADIQSLNELSTTTLSLGQTLFVGYKTEGDVIPSPSQMTESQVTHQNVAAGVSAPVETPTLPKTTVIYSYPQSERPQWIARKRFPLVVDMPYGITDILASVDVKQMLNFPGTSVTQRGIAYWQKGQYSDEMIVMHSKARVNSKISIYNPMLKRSVQAKVVSEVPKGAFPNDVSVVISPSVANALGALDSRFLVEITYIE